MNKIKRTGMITRKYDRNNYFFLQKVKEIFCKKVKVNNLYQLATFVF